MLFWLSFAFVLSPVVGFAVGALIGRAEWAEKKERNLRPSSVGEDVVTPIFVCTGLASFGLLVSIGAWTAWDEHAADMSKVEAQHHRIEVYEERIESLEDRLAEFPYPEKADISLDADTPWASMVKALNDAESELAQAKDEKAIAIRSIRARQRGPWSGVITLVGMPEGMPE